MPLATGTRLGPYDVLAPLGAGGMGEVYRARDTRLGRDVAIKVLPGAVAGDAERRARFEREAKAVAALDHPHICGIYDVGDADGTHYLVMPLLDGQTLAARVEKGALPLDQALTIATEIADALDKAHRRGIVHRDLKPANVMLTKAGAKLLDFGLAKLRAPGGPVRLTDASETAATAATGTAEGTILGTVHYMAPEQVEGREADARTDIWALGAVLYEMVTGVRPFQGDTAASVIGAILKDQPQPLSARQPVAPAVLDRIVGRSLQKDPDARWQSASDLRAALDIVGAIGATAGPASGSAVVAGRTAGRLRLASALAGGLLFVGPGTLVLNTPATPPDSPPLVQFHVHPPEDAVLSPAPVAGTPQLALSPDGQQLAFVAMRRRGVSQIYVRPLSGLDARPLPTTDGASFPFWSPDGQSLGFFAGGKLRRIALGGGTAQVVADAPAGRGGFWNADGTIVFSPTPQSQLFRVSSTGGPTIAVSEIGAGTQGQDTAQIIGHNWPQALPGGRFIYYQRSGNPALEGIYLGGRSGQPAVRVMAADGLAQYSSGHLAFVRDGMLMVQPLDESFRTAGDVVRLADRVAQFRFSFGYSAIAAAPSGVLAYGPPISTLTRLRWFDRRGAPRGDLGVAAPYVSPRLSADGRTVAVAIAGDTMAERDVWILDVARDTASRVTSDPNADWFPAWGTNGRLYFGSTRTGVTSIFQKSGVQPENLVEVKSTMAATYPHDISQDGRHVAHVQSTTRGYDIGVTTLGGSPVSTPFLATGFNEVQPRFSQNQRWIAYASDETGQFEVYVRPYPSSDAQWQISSGGGMQPEWGRDGKELFFLSREGKLMVVPVVTAGNAFEAGVPQPLFDVETPEAVAPFPTHYAVAADGQRFLVNTVIDQPARPAITLMLNWTAALKPPRP